MENSFGPPGEMGELLDCSVLPTNSICVFSPCLVLRTKIYHTTYPEALTKRVIHEPDTALDVD